MLNPNSFLHFFSLGDLGASGKINIGGELCFIVLYAASSDTAESQFSPLP
jgi:hypothetical protein